MVEGGKFDEGDGGVKLNGIEQVGGIVVVVGLLYVEFVEFQVFVFINVLI